MSARGAIGYSLAATAVHSSARLDSYKGLIDKATTVNYSQTSVHLVVRTIYNPPRTPRI